MNVMKLSKVQNVQQFGELKVCRNRLTSIQKRKNERGETRDVQLTERGCKGHPDAPDSNLKLVFSIFWNPIIFKSLVFGG
jgi:hypothetical protein